LQCSAVPCWRTVRELNHHNKTGGEPAGTSRRGVEPTPTAAPNSIRQTHFRLISLPRRRLFQPIDPPLNCDKSLVLTGRYDEYAGKLLQRALDFCDPRIDTFQFRPHAKKGPAPARMKLTAVRI
jgi:hypothetical protein